MSGWGTTEDFQARQRTLASRSHFRTTSYKSSRGKRWRGKGQGGWRVSSRYVEERGIQEGAGRALPHRTITGM